MTPEGRPLLARWWLIPSWHKGGLGDWKATTFNARIEDAATKPSFRAVWNKGRCLIPMTGYFEWTGGKGRKTPHFLTGAGNEENLFAAGLASRWGELLTCTILTRAANADVAAVHPRMPVILDTSERDLWLSGRGNPATLGENARIVHHPVRRFGRDDESPDLIKVFGGE